MKVTQEELSHLIFLSEVILNGNKKARMEEMLRCLLYIVKSVEEVELPDSAGEQIAELLAGLENELRTENDRLQEIKSNLSGKSMTS